MRYAIPALAAFALLLLVPTLIWGPAPIDSAVYNYVWTKQFGEALEQGVLYPRWLPDSFRGVGSPTFYFYPPIAFYISGSLQVAGLSTFHAIAGAVLLTLFGSGLAMAVWLKFKGANPLWALLYMAAPYHLTDWYERAALAEFVSFVWLPLIALAIDAQPRRWATPLLAVSFAGLVMTHLPVALLVSVGLIAPMVLARREHLVSYATAGVMGLGLCAIYLLPALTLQHHISMEAMFSPQFRPENWAPWSPNASLWIVPIALAPVALSLGKAHFWTGVTIFSAAMSLVLVPLVWGLPLLDKVQFPWRMMVIAEFAAVTAVALSRPQRVILTIAVAVSLSSYARIINVATYSVSRPYTSNIFQDLPDAPEYLPAGTFPTPAAAASRVIDFRQIAKPTLGPSPVLQTILGGWISLLAAGVLGIWLAIAYWPRRTLTPRERTPL